MLIGLREHPDEDEIVQSMFSSSDSFSEFESGGVGSRGREMNSSEGGGRRVLRLVILFSLVVY